MAGSDAAAEGVVVDLGLRGVVGFDERRVLQRGGADAAVALRTLGAAEAVHFALDVGELLLDRDQLLVLLKQFDLKAFGVDLELLRQFELVLDEKFLMENAVLVLMVFGFQLLDLI